MQLEIRKATSADIDIIAPLFDSYRIFYKQQTNVAAAANFITERLQQNESVILIAFLDGEAAGFTQLYPIFSSVGMRRAWLLNDLFVAEKARRKGIAEALLDKAKEFGKENNAAWLLLQTGKENKTAQSVYEKNGWEKVSDFFYECGL